MPDAGTGLLIVTVAAPTNAVEASHPSSRSTAGIERQVSIHGGGQQPRARDELQRPHVGTFTGPAGLFRQTSTPSPETRRLHAALDIALPPRILDLDPEQPGTP